MRLAIALVLAACTHATTGPAHPADEAQLDPVLRQRASADGKYSGLVATFEATGDVDKYGTFHDDGYWQGGTYEGRIAPGGYWVYVAPTWYIWSRAQGAPAPAASAPVAASPTAKPGCPPPQNLDDVQHTLDVSYGGVGYGGDGRARVVVVVEDYATFEPLAGVPVHLHHNLNGPCTRDRGCVAQPNLDQDAITDAAGRAIFAVNDLEYQFTISAHTLSSYLPYTSTMELGAKQCHPILITAPKVDRGTKYFVTHLVPRSMLTVTTRDQAVAAATAVPEIKSWLPSNTQYQISVEGGPTVWQVRWGDGKTLKRLVYVNAFDGSATVGGRWGD